MGIRQTAQPIGVGVAAITIAVIADRHGISTALWVPTVAALVAALLVAVVVLDPPRPPRKEGSAPNPYRQDTFLARIHAVQGKTDQAIGELSEAIRDGWIPPFLPIHVDIALDPPLAELKPDPRFEPLRQQILRHLAKERAELGPVRLS